MDRYCSWPGQACGYKVGHSEINRQRERVKEAVGSKYDLKAFNDTVVLGGNVPLDVLAGNDDIFLRCLETGGAGGILVASHVVGPELREIYDAVQAGDGDRAAEIEGRIRPIFEAMTVTAGPIPAKAATEMLGLIPSARMRLPMVEVDSEQRAQVRQALEAHGLLSASAA